MRARPYAEVLGSLRGQRRGITTGTCAQAAARAAALAVVGRVQPDFVELRLPVSSRPYSGALLRIPLVFLRREGEGYRAGVRKDAGDDVDVTNGLVIEALVSPGPGLGVLVEGGSGVGRVSRPGLPIPPGRAAINPTPLAMIRRDLEALAPQGMGFSVLVEVPGGEAAARATWNPRLGIVGGISIIGTSGVVEPRSSAAFRKSIARAAKAMVASGCREAHLTPGYVGEAYLHGLGLGDAQILLVGDHVGYGLRALAHHGAARAVLVGHAGKIVKIAAGLFNTHSRYGDARLETLAALAAADGAGTGIVRQILGLGTVEEAAGLLADAGLDAVFGTVARRASERAGLLSGIDVEVVILALDGRVLGSHPGPGEGP